jgi:glycosyltransferase involved in cell wall biosynthesis
MPTGGAGWTSSFPRDAANSEESSHNSNLTATQSRREGYLLWRVINTVQHRHVKLAIVTETFPPEINGVAMTFGTIARELGRRGHTVTVYRPHRNDLADPESHPEYKEVPLPGMAIPRYPMLRLGFPAQRRLRSEWTASPPDLVHVVTEGPLGASAVSAARALGIPVTSSFHTNFHAYARHYGFAPLNLAVLGWLKRIHNRTQRTFAPTLELCTELRTLGFQNIALLSRGVDTRQFDPSRRSAALRLSWGAGEGDPVVIHAGRMAPEKNYDLLFLAFNAARQANPRCRFVLVGDGPLRVRLERLNPNCIFTGFIPRDELARAYASADIYIHASQTETFGNVLTEAMASGLAVAGFDYAAARQFVRHGKNGLVAPYEQPGALVEAAKRLATDDLLRETLRIDARRAVETQSWENVIAGFEAELLRVANLSAGPLHEPIVA